MRYLLDANVVLDKTLLRARHPEVDALFNRVTGDQFCISRFSLHAIAWYVCPRNAEAFRNMCMDFSMSGVSIVDLAIEELPRVVDAMGQWKLDFDDAFNVTVAAKFHLTIISFDADYDRTPGGRKTPAQAVVDLNDTKP